MNVEPQTAKYNRTDVALDCGHGRQSEARPIEWALLSAYEDDSSLSVHVIILILENEARVRNRVQSWLSEWPERRRLFHVLAKWRYSAIFMLTRVLLRKLQSRQCRGTRGFYS